MECEKCGKFISIPEYNALKIKPAKIRDGKFVAMILCKDCIINEYGLEEEQ